MVFLNGRLIPLEEAKVPVLDRGFIFGDGVYELIPVYSRVAFRLDEHLARLERSLAETRIRNPHTRAQWREIIYRLVGAPPFEAQGGVFPGPRGGWRGATPRSRGPQTPRCSRWRPRWSRGRGKRCKKARPP